MTVQYSRVQRRVDLARMKKRALKMWRFTYDWSPIVANRRLKDEYYKIACRFANNMKACSCWGCGNPRRHRNRISEQITIQEKRFLDKYQYELLEVDYGNEYD